MEPLLSFAWLPFTMLLFGFWSFFSPFSMAYWLCTAAFFIAVRRLTDLRTAALAASIGGIALWTSIMTTERRLPQTHPLELGNPNAEAGWPLVAFRYPIPPMGNDVPPFAQWPAFFSDYAFWLAAGAALAPLAARLIPSRGLRARFLILPGILVALLGLGQTMLKFD